jgi:hypothetical protein
MELDLELDFDDTPARRLSRYVRLITAALGLRGNSSVVQAQPPANAYVALDGRLPGFPDHDVALLWDARSGWAAAIESAAGGDLVPVAQLDHEISPPPPVVVRWATSLFRQDGGVTASAPDQDDHDLVRRCALDTPIAPTSSNA